MGRCRPKAFFLSHYSGYVIARNTYVHPKKTLGLEDLLCWIAFPQRQPGLRSEQVKFRLGLERPTITSTSVQTRFERQGKFLNFYEVFSKDFSFFESYIDFSLQKILLMNFYEAYEYFPKIFLFLSHTDFSFQKIFFNEFPWSLWVFSKDFSFFESYWFLIFYSTAQHTSTEVSRILRARKQRVNYLDYLDCSKVMNFLVNVCIFPFPKKR